MSHQVDLELHVMILNLRYHVRGLAAIAELKIWLDEHASGVVDCNTGQQAQAPEPRPPRETAMLRGNGPDPQNVPAGQSLDQALGRLPLFQP